MQEGSAHQWEKDLKANPTPLFSLLLGQVLLLIAAVLNPHSIFPFRVLQVQEVIRCSQDGCNFRATSYQLTLGVGTGFVYLILLAVLCCTVFCAVLPHTTCRAVLCPVLCTVL